MVLGGVYLGCFGVFLGLQIPCEKQHRMQVVVFGDPAGVSWGLLGATNSLQKTIQDAPGGVWGSVGTPFGSNMAREWSQMSQDRLEMA